MPNYRRWRKKGASYFFTVVTYKRRKIFHQDFARKLLKQSMAITRKKYSFEMFACVLLPDHLHCLWTLPDHDENFSIRWANIKRHFTSTYLQYGGNDLPVTQNKNNRQERGIWQSRFWEHYIRDEEDWYKHRDYIHLNPVKHEYVSDPRDWPWSSIHRHIQLGWLDPNWPGSTPIDDLPDVGE